ncbi:rho GTPase-activating protein 8 isoform X2 [Marmota monax]|uniref:rho GTPase-activating protein 8 isoform X2 n=1 Tax=Marmota monax TaxID=9995 RepID=UPI001EAFC76D|nr:rho GTPase-activating protein 8 isoform X2 [Marmota monax]
MAGQDPALSTSHPFYDVARHGILQVAGDDRCGRLIVTFSCCRMPPSHELDHQRLLEYLKFTLDQYVENDYSLVYFHHGLHGGNKPSLGWLQSAYKEFDRKYKKNLKALYVVHPTSFIKVLWKLFKPLISHKFGKKVTYCSSLRELREHLQCDQLPIPQEVLRYDEKLRDLHRGLPPPDTKKPPPRPPLPTQQFGVSLQYPYACSGRGRRGCSSHSSGKVGSATGWPHQSAPQRQESRSAHPPGAVAHGDLPAGERWPLHLGEESLKPEQRKWGRRDLSSHGWAPPPAPSPPPASSVTSAVTRGSPSRTSPTQNAIDPRPCPGLCISWVHPTVVPTRLDAARAPGPLPSWPCSVGPLSAGQLGRLWRTCSHMRCLRVRPGCTPGPGACTGGTDGQLW